MRLYIPPTLQPHLNGLAVVDTDTMDQDQIQRLYGALCELSERVEELAKPDDRPDLQDEITALTSTLIDAIEVPEVAPVRQPTPVAVMAPTVDNPHRGKVKNLRGNFGEGVHEKMHFAPTDTKSHHGVWGTTKVAQVRKWVRLALDSIYGGDPYVVASKPGNKPGARTYLVNMDTVVGYLSGSAMVNKPKQMATHIEIYLDAKGTTVSAFPSDPSIF